MTTVEVIVENKLPYVFYDYNATLNYANCYSHVNDLVKIDWDLFFERPRLDGYCKYWLSDLNNPRYIRRMETRQAEFLIYEQVPLKLMSMVGVYSEAKATEVRKIFEDAHVDLDVQAKEEWYY